MAKIYKEQMIAILTQLGIAIPDHLTMDQKQIEHLVAAIETALDTYDPLPTGDALVSDVLVDKTFSNATGTGLTGTMPDSSGNVEVEDLDGTAIPAGYHDGTGLATLSATEAAKVITGNILAGVTLLGVAGKTEVVDTTLTTTAAAAGDIASGKEAYVNGVLIVGTAV